MNEMRRLMRLLETTIGPVYHGSQHEFAAHEFREGPSVGFWFTTSREYAARFGQVKTFNLTVHRLLDLTDDEPLLRFIAQTPAPDDPNVTYTKEEVLADPFEGMNDWYWQIAVMQRAKSLGYDAVMFTDGSDPDTINPIVHDSIVVFDRNQIVPA